MTVYWMELPTRENSTDTRIFGVPLKVSDRLVETLYEGMQTIVFTSATLGIRGKLDYFVRRMGLDLLPEDHVSLLCLGSPFDYEAQALVCAPTFIPSPKSAEYQESVEALSRDLALGVQRSTMILFTSYGMLNRTYNAIKPDLQSEGILLLGQGIDGSPTNITERFRLNGQAVLLGTDSFWEGIDLPGETLEILGIARLPFAVPTEPLVAAQMEELEKQGKDPFLNYSVPEAILKFRQGFGRLIRNRTDRGAVLILDSRGAQHWLRTRLPRIPACRTSHLRFQAGDDPQDSRLVCEDERSERTRNRLKLRWRPIFGFRRKISNQGTPAETARACAAGRSPAGRPGLPHRQRQPRRAEQG